MKRDVSTLLDRRRHPNPNTHLRNVDYPAIDCVVGAGAIPPERLHGRLDSHALMTAQIPFCLRPSYSSTTLSNLFVLKQGRPDLFAQARFYLYRGTI